MTTPAWLLLVWSGLAASCVAAAIGATIGGTPAAAWSLAPLPRSRMHGLGWSLIAGLFVYPVLYGICFEVLHRADFRTGLAIGLIHGLIIAFIAWRQSLARGDSTPARPALRAGIMNAIYGAVIAFLYITP